VFGGSVESGHVSSERHLAGNHQPINFMAHTRKDTLTAPGERWKHLKWMKQKHAKAERRACRDMIQKTSREIMEKWAPTYEKL